MNELNLAALNAVDISILVVLGISIIIGFGRGLVSEILSLITIIAAFVIAVMFTSQLADYFTHTEAVKNVVDQSTTAVGANTEAPVTYMALGVSFAILFAGTVIVGSVIKILLNLIFNSGILGIGNRLLGAIFGVARGYLFCLAIIFLVQLSPFAKQPWWQESHYVPYFESQVVWLGDKVSPVLADLKSTFAEKMQNIQGDLAPMENKIDKPKKMTE